MANRITYYKLNSPYEGDITKNCALTGGEVDGNFLTLEGRDIKSVELDDGKIFIHLYNGETLSTEGDITEGCVKDITFEFDEKNGVLSITKDGVTQEISGFAVNIPSRQKVSVDGTIIGNGSTKSPLGISPALKTGQYRPVKAIIDTTEGQRLPHKHYLFPGDRFLTKEKVNEFGYLFNYHGVMKIACRLKEMGSEWRIPTKQDWDDMLNAIEPEEEYRNHSKREANVFLGKYAGKLLKSKKYWKNNFIDWGFNDNLTDGDDTDDIDIDTDGDTNTDNGTDTGNNTDNGADTNTHNNCHRDDYCGEWGHCHHKHHKEDTIGIDKYGFRILPAGYAEDEKNFLYFKERALFWTASNKEYRKAYVKGFDYGRNKVYQDVYPSGNYLSVRLVKDYTGDNYNERENILGGSYSTVLLPSVEHGRAIWTSVNLSLADCVMDSNFDEEFEEFNCHPHHHHHHKHSVDYVKPNNGEGMDAYDKIRFFINEWNGKQWIRKELGDGESVVVINEIKKEGTEDAYCNCYNHGEPPVFEKVYKEYRVINHKLVDVENVIFDKVVEKFQGNIDNIEGEITELNTKVDNETQARKDADTALDERIDREKAARKEKDSELEGKIADETQARSDADEALTGLLGELSESLADEKTEREEKDSELEGKIADETQARSDADEALSERIDAIGETFDGKIQELEGKIADEEAVREEKDSELEGKIADEKTAREAADTALDERIDREKAARKEKDSELEGKIHIQEGSEYNGEKLTIKSKDGSNDIEIEFGFNFGTF